LPAPYTFIVLHGTKNSTEEINISRTTHERRLAAKVALITGDSPGIGAAIAERSTRVGTSRCVSEAIRGLAANRSLVIPGRMNRIMNAIVPASVTRTMMAKMLEKSLATKLAARQIEAKAR
jgi:NAD(P)-dependent dehydrogenase (short-subunit alcohol dehydrogenase family)